MLRGLYVHQKSRYTKLLSWDIAKILQTCLVNSGIPGQSHQKQKNINLQKTLMFFHRAENEICHSFLSGVTLDILGHVHQI